MLTSSVLIIGCSVKLDPELAEKQVEKGIQALRIFDFSSAYDLLEPAVPALSEDAAIYVEAKYALAVVLWHKSPPSAENIDRALELFHQLLERDDLNPELRGQIQLDLGRIYEVVDYPGDEKDVARARTQYEMVIEKFKGTELGFQAVLRLENTYAKLLTDEGFRKQIEILENYLESNQDAAVDGGWKSIAYGEIGDAYFYGLGQPQPALEAYKKAHQFGFTQPENVDREFWKIAACAEAAGQKADAIKYYTLVANDIRSRYHTQAALILKDKYGVKAMPDNG
jgi:tetratricopeptide (TPR) repeat protein